MTHDFRGMAYLIAIAFTIPSAHAAELYATDGLSVRWDNDLRYSAGVRLEAPDPVILSYPNSDDGDRDFAHGLMSNRLDLLSVLDVTGGPIGLQLSVEGWYDSVYQSHTDNNSPATYNPISVPNSQFAHAVKNLDGQHVDVADSFVYGNFHLGEVPLSLRVGRQTLLWGESLFFFDNGIAAAQAPVDYIKSSSAPEGYSKDAFLPVNQISLTVEPRAGLSLAAYYQLEWRPSRLAGVGSYFSDTDVAGAGAERAFLSQGQYLLHAPDRAPPGGGQFGVSLRASVDDFDFGLYALRYHAKYPVLHVDLITPNPSGFAGTFESIYPAGIDLYGGSFSSYVWDSTIAGEISTRRHMPLVSVQPISLTFAGPARDLGYAEGDTLHGQISATSTLEPAALWDSADLGVEIAGNDLLDVTHNAAALGTGRTRFAASIRALFQPHYFEVAPHLDLTAVLGAGLNLTGRSSTDYAQNAGTGDYEFGVSASYRSVWKVDLTLTSFVGVPYRQSLSDRDFLMLSVERAF